MLYHKLLLYLKFFLLEMWDAMWMDEEVFRLLYWWYSLKHNVEKRLKHFSTEHENKLFLLDNSIKSLPVLVCLIKFGAQLIQPRAMGEAGTKFGSFISCGCELDVIATNYKRCLNFNKREPNCFQIASYVINCLFC